MRRLQSRSRRAVWSLSLFNRPSVRCGPGTSPRAAMCVRNVDVHVSCSSHVNAQLAAFFIDPRAKGSTEMVCIFYSQPTGSFRSRVDANILDLEYLQVQEYQRAFFAQKRTTWRVGRLRPNAFHARLSATDPRPSRDSKENDETLCVWTRKNVSHNLTPRRFSFSRDDRNGGCCRFGSRGA